LSHKNAIKHGKRDNLRFSDNPMFPSQKNSAKTPRTPPWISNYCMLRNYLSAFKTNFQMNKSLPLNYDFEFVVEEVTNVSDKGNYDVMTDNVWLVTT
jgi:hypothetical protein